MPDPRGYLMARSFPLVAAIVLVISAGVAQGLWSHRWTASREIAAAVAHLDGVPMNFGEWEGQNEELDRAQLEMAEISGYLMRRYKNRRDGSALSILLVCGRTGPISVHSPDICYAGAGFQLEGDAVRHTVKSDAVPRPAGFWVGDFFKTGNTVPEHLRIYWSWNATGEWAAPENPRPFFAGSQVLYKLYVIIDSTGRTARPGTDRGAAFIEELLPQLDRSLASDRQPVAHGGN
jgi:hypothetical protein